jgi:aspartate-semialdehyde dehydrogenase
MAARGTEAPGRYCLAVVGRSPLALAVRQALVDRHFPYSEVRLLGAVQEGEAVLTEFDGEPRILAPAGHGALEGVHLAFFCEDPATGGAYRDWPERVGCLAIDLSDSATGLTDLPLASTSSPRGPLAPSRGWLAAPHPLAHLLVSLLAPLEERVRLEGVRGVILRPAADFGQEGLDELLQQSVSLLNFSQPPSRVFQHQLAFNLIPAEAMEADGGLSSRLAAQVTALLGRPELPCRLFLAVAPVFHAHTIILQVEFEGRPSEAALRDLLRSSGEVRVAPRPLTAAEVADERLPHVGLVRPEAGGRAAWLWAVADRVSQAGAEEAVRLAERMLKVDPPPGRRPYGVRRDA